MEKEIKTVIAPNHFADDLDKVDDFFSLDEETFLNFYSHISKIEYVNTHNELVRRGDLKDSLIDDTPLNLDLKDLKFKIQTLLNRLDNDTTILKGETSPNWDLNDMENWNNLNNSLSMLKELFNGTFNLMDKMKNNQIFQDKNYLSTNLENDENFKLDTLYKIIINGSRNGNYDLVDTSTGEVVCEFQNNDRI